MNKIFKFVTVSLLCLVNSILLYGSNPTVAKSKTVALHADPFSQLDFSQASVASQVRNVVAVAQEEWVTQMQTMISLAQSKRNDGACSFLAQDFIARGVYLDIHLIPVYKSLGSQNHPAHEEFVQLAREATDYQRTFESFLQREYALRLRHQLPLILPILNAQLSTISATASEKANELSCNDALL